MSIFTASDRLLLESTQQVQKVVKKLHTLGLCMPKSDL
jgi:hypothetical protein